MLSIPLTNEQRDLVEKNLGLVRAFVHRHCGPTLDRDDLFQNCALMMMSSAQGWKPERGAFSTWATLGMRSVVQRALRRRSMVSGTWPRPVAIPLDEPFDGEGLTLEEQTSNPDTVPVDVELDFKRRARAALPRDSRQREILQRRADGDTLEQIGDDMGLTRERVRQIETSGLKAARRKAIAESLSLGL